MRSKRAIIAAALAAAMSTALPAAAQSSAHAFLGNLGYELIDLTPDDGIAPTITFTGAITNFATSNLYADPGFTQLTATSTMFGSQYGTTYVANTDGAANAGASEFAVSADVAMLNNSGSAQAFNVLDFVLSANSRVIFTAFGTVEAMPDFFNGGAAYAFASLTGAIFNDSSDGMVSFGAGMFSQLLREDRYLAAVAQTGAFEAAGFVGLTTGAESMSIAAPVPEPRSVAMLAAGLALVGGLARKRKSRG